MERLRRAWATPRRPALRPPSPGDSAWTRSPRAPPAHTRCRRDRSWRLDRRLWRAATRPSGRGEVPSRAPPAAAESIAPGLSTRAARRARAETERARAWPAWPYRSTRLPSWLRHSYSEFRWDAARWPVRLAPRAAAHTLHIAR